MKFAKNMVIDEFLLDFRILQIEETNFWKFKGFLGKCWNIIKIQIK